MWNVYVKCVSVCEQVHGRGLGLLSTKIAVQNPKSTVVTMKYQEDDTDAHLSLNSLLHVTNNLLCQNKVDAAIANHIIADTYGQANTEKKAEKEAAEKEPPFRYSVISLDVFQRLILTAQVTSTVFTISSTILITNL